MTATPPTHGSQASLPATGVTLDHVVRGEAGGPDVLLVMGLGGQRILWPEELVEALVARGCRVITYDHRDVGGSTVLGEAPGGLDDLQGAFSGTPFASPYRLADLALDAVGLLDHLGIDRAHVVGVSMGGMIGQHLAFDHPARVASLTSINSTPGASLPPEPLQEPVAVPDPSPPEEVGPDEFADWLVDGLRELSHPRWFDEEETRELARAIHERGVHPGATVRHLLAILADGDRTDRLRRVTAPTLVVHGADDPLVPLDQGRATADAIPGARLVVIEEMAHEIPMPLIGRLTGEIADHIDAAERAAAPQRSPDPASP